MDLFIPLLRANFEFPDTYCYGGDTIFNCSISISISIFGGRDETQITFYQLESWQDFFV